MASNSKHMVRYEYVSQCERAKLPLYKISGVMFVYITRAFFWNILFCYYYLGPIDDVSSSYCSLLRR